uniref:Tight junction protein ZO-1-like n=1 Tax=Oncorhynchus tshawytscha TaxID=74940 RepID=A0AAZ3P2C2_ONCTS
MHLPSLGYCIDKAVEEALVLKMFESGTKKWFVKKQQRQKPARSVARKPYSRKKKKWAAKILKRNRERILNELDVNNVLPYLVYDKVFSLGEHKEILEQDSRKKRVEVFLDQLSLKGPSGLSAFCCVLEEVCPHLLTCFLLDCEGTDTVLLHPGNLPHGRASRGQGQGQGHGHGHGLGHGSGSISASSSVSSIHQAKPSLRRIKGRIHRSKSLDSIDLLDSKSAAMEETVIWEQHTVTLHRAPGFGFGIAISGGRDNPHFQSGETSIVISDVLKGGPAEGLLQENDRVTMVNAVSMDNVEHAYAVQQLRKSGKNAKITIRRKRKVHVPMSRLGERATMSEHDDEEEDEEDSYDEEIYETRSARSGPSAYSAVGGASARRSGRSAGRREKDRERERSGSRERSLSPRADRRSLNQPPRPAKVTLVKSRKNEDISDIHSVASDHSNRSHDRHRSSRSRSPDRRSDPSDHSRHSPPQISNGSHRSREEEERISKPTAVPPKLAEQAPALPKPPEKSVTREEKPVPPLPEPKPVYAQPGQPDVDLPVSPADAPVPSAAHDDSILRPSMKLVKFKKGESVGLRLAGGNDVGIFVAGVLEDSPAAKEGLEEGDQILRVNNVDFANIIREEAVLFLLDLPKGEEVTILAQKKKDVYRRIVESDVGDSFYIRTHFEYEKESPYGLSFNKGEVFRVVDTLYNGKLGSWLAIRIGKNHQEVERGIIPNKNRAEQLSSMQYTLPKTAGGDRADFWRFRGLRSSKRNLRKSREDLSAQPVQTKFPAYERVVLREAGFLRPVVVFGPIADVAREKISREEPDLFELAKSEPRDAGTDQRSSGIIRLHTIKQIIDRDKHAVLDITPNAVDRLNYAQWYPIVVFLNPDSKQGVKNMRTRLCSESRKSARKLYERALKLRKNNHHLFTTTINMNNMNDGWYGALKETVQQQQNQLVWVSEGKADGAPDDDLDIHDDRLSYLSAPGSEYSMYSTDSRHTSDYEDTDTEGGAYTDQELDETLNDEVGLPTEPAITRSSEPVREDPPVIQDPSSGGYSGYQHASVTPSDPANCIDPSGFKMSAAPQQTESQQPVLQLEGMTPDLEEETPVAAPQAADTLLSSPSPAPTELAPPPTPPSLEPQHLSQSPLGPGPEPKMYKKDLYSLEEPVRVNHGGMKSSLSYTQQPYQDKQPYRQYDHPPYAFCSDRGGYAEPKPQQGNFDSHLQYDNRVPQNYDDGRWPPYDQQTSSPQPPGYQPGPVHQQGYPPRGTTPYEDGPVRDYSPPQPRYDEAPAGMQGYDGKPRHGKPPGPMRYDEPSLPPSAGPYDACSPYEAEPPHGYCLSSPRSPEPPKQYYGDSAPGLRPSYNPVPPSRGGGYNREPLMTSDPPLPPHKPEPLASPGEMGVNAGSKPLPPPPRGEEEKDDPAMKPQSVLNRVKMFENKRSVSVDRAKEAGDSTVMRPADLPRPMTAPGPVPKANSLSNLEQEKPTYRSPEPQNAPGSKPLDDVAHSSNHYDADEDEEYYRKQLSYFDRRSFDSKTMNPTPGINRFPPQTQLAYPYNRAESMEKVSPVEKRYEPLPQISPVSQYGPPSPAVPPNSLPKLTTNDVNSQPDNLLSASPKHDLSGLRPSTLQDLPSQPYLAQRSPVGVNGTDAPPKTPGTTPTPQSYNRYVPKPYTSSARPFERKFESPKFNHNLLPNDLLISSSNPKPSVVNNNSRTKPPLSPQALDHDSGLDTFTRTMDNRGPKYQQHNNLVNNAVPKAIPVSVLEDDEEDEGHTVVATARGIFNCNGGVLSSIETGVSIIIPQGAIPDSIEQEIYFKVCRDNSILPPLDKEKGETLLSPLVMCGPHGLQFLKPVELRLPHCASMTPDGWSFALKSSDSSSGDSKTWQNKSLPGDPNYLVGANCVSVLIDHF